MIKKFLYFFNKNQKKYLLIFLSLMFISTILEMLGLGFIFSIVGILSDSDERSNIIVTKLSTLYDLDRNEIFSYFAIVFLIFYVIKIVFLIFYNWFENKFSIRYNRI